MGELYAKAVAERGIFKLIICKKKKKADSDNKCR